MASADRQPVDGEERVEQEVARQERETLAGSYLARALAELRASGSSEALYPITRVGVRVSRAMRGKRGRRIAKGRQVEHTRSGVLFAMLAAEAFANQYLQVHLSGEEFAAADRLPTLDKFILGPRLVRGEDLLERGREPAQTLKKLLGQRSALVHPKLAKPGQDGPIYTPEEVAQFIVAVVDAATWLMANSDPPPERLPMGIIAVEREREYFLEFGRKATERLPEINDDPAPDLILTVWGRWMDEEREKQSS